MLAEQTQEAKVSRHRNCSAVVLLLTVLAAVAHAESQFVMERGRSTIVLEPYAANIVRVTLSRHKEAATAAPGYGFLVLPSATGWNVSRENGSDLLKSERLTVKVPANSENLTVNTPDGTVLVNLRSWSMNPAVVAGGRPYHGRPRLVSPPRRQPLGSGEKH